MNYLLRFLTTATTLVCWLLSNPATAQSLAFDRAVVCGTGGGYYRWGPKAIALDAQGNTYVAGTFNGTIALGNTLLTATTQIGPNFVVPLDNFVAKLDAAGNYLWATQVGGLHDLFTDCVVSDDRGGVYVTGAFRSFSVRFGATGPTLFNSSAQREGFVAKLDAATGQWLWARRAGGTGNDGLGQAVVNAAGDLYVLGGSGSTAADVGPFTLTGPQLFLARLTPAGTWLWARQLGDGKVNYPNLMLDGQGGIYLAGRFEAPSVRFGATTLTTQGVPGSPYATTGGDLFVAKTDDAGTWYWAVQGDAATHTNLIQSVYAALDGTGHLYLTGSYASTAARIGATVLPNQSTTYPPPVPSMPVPYTNHRFSDAFAARLNVGTGAWEWAVRRGGLYHESAGQVTVDTQGRAYAAGYFTSVALGDDGPAQLAALNGATGTWLSFSPLPPHAINRLVMDGQGRLHLAGSFDSPTATFGPVTLAQAGPGQSTGYIARTGAGGPLAATHGGTARRQLQVWPNPSGGGPVWVQGGAPGQAVQVLDALGRAVATGRMPTSGPLRLEAAGGLAPGLYVVRSGGQAQRLVVE